MTNSAPEPPPGDLLSFARLVIDAREAARIDYALGGALAVAAWAEARSTQDVDLVIIYSKNIRATSEPSYWPRRAASTSPT